MISRFKKNASRSTSLILLVLSGAALVTSGCDRNRLIDTVETGSFSENLPFETVGIGQRITITATTELIIRTEAEWLELSRTMTPYEAFSTIDFDQVMLAVVAVQVDSGGWAVDVESVEQADGKIEVAYVISEPGVDCITPQALATPFQVIKVRKMDGDVTFISRSESFSCQDF